MNRSKKLAFTQLAMLIAGVLLSVDIGRAQGEWEISAPGQGPDLSAAFALSWKSGDDHFQSLWLGDADGNFGVVLNPEKDRGYFRWKTIPVVTAGTKPRTKPPSVPVNDIYFSDPQNGYLLRGNTIYETHSGGHEWSVFLKADDRNRATATLYSLSFFPENQKRGCVVGVYSRNNTVTQSLVLCGNLPVAGAPARWLAVTPPIQDELFHIALVGEKRGWIVGSEGTILETSDAGGSWQPQDAPTKASLFQVYFRNSDRGWAVGENGTILRTKNGGKDWLRIRHQLDNIGPSFIGVKFANDKEGWVVGHQGVILHTRNGGSDNELWERQNSKTQADLYALSIDRKYCWAVGGKGLILRYRLPK